MIAYFIISINLLAAILVFTCLRHDIKKLCYYKMLYDNIDGFSEEMLESVHELDTPVKVNIAELEEIVNKNINNMRTSYKKYIKDYGSRVFIHILLLVLNGGMLIFNLIHYNIFYKLAILCIKLFIRIIGR